MPNSLSDSIFKSIHITLAFVLLISFSIDNSYGLTARNVIDSPLLTEKISTNRTIKVDINGNGEFKSIQAAIDSVPQGNSQWTIIHVRKGIYREKVHVPSSKPYIFLRGNGKGRTLIVWSKSSSDDIESATFRVDAPNFIAFGVTFKNEAPTGVAYTSQNQSVAAFVAADKVAFYHCGFYSTHDTLFDYEGRHYYGNCYIQGSVDFIFGRGRSIFHNCELFVIDDMRLSVQGSVTGQSRKSADDNTGFVFNGGKLYGISGAYLGRVKGAFSRVIFSKTYFSLTVQTAGWTNSSYFGSTENVFHAEHECYGPGSETKKRAPWAKQLTDKEAAPFLNISFIDGADWLPAWL